MALKTSSGLAVTCNLGDHLSPTQLPIPVPKSDRHSEGMGDLGDASYDKPSVPLPQWPLPTVVPQHGRPQVLPQCRNPMVPDPIISAPLELGVTSGNASLDNSLRPGTDQLSKVSQGDTVVFPA